MKKRFLSAVLILSLLSGIMAGCGRAPETPNVTDDTQATVTEPAAADKVSAEPERPRLKKIPQIKNQDTYITIEEASSGYDSALITDDMIASSTLQEATVSGLPYWTGFVLENKMLANITNDGRWTVIPTAFSIGTRGSLN